MSIFISIHILFLSAFTLVAEKSGCASKNDKFAGSFINITVCAEACKNESTMFLFGRSDGSRCNVDGKCRCKCILGASLNGSCLYEPRNGYNLYRNNIAAVCKSIFIQKSEICVIRGGGWGSYMAEHGYWPIFSTGFGKIVYISADFRQQE